jgi:hypothetical protein
VLAIALLAISQLLYKEWCKAQAAAVLNDGVAACAQVQITAPRLMDAHLQQQQQQQQQTGS